MDFGSHCNLEKRGKWICQLSFSEIKTHMLLQRSHTMQFMSLKNRKSCRSVVHQMLQFYWLTLPCM